MQKGAAVLATAKVFTTGHSQAVCLPIPEREFQERRNPFEDWDEEIESPDNKGRFY
jgi:hypothetical protein